MHVSAMGACPPFSLPPKEPILPTITCDKCGALVNTDLHEPVEASQDEIERWWDDHGENWCPAFGEFRQILNRGAQPCEA